MQTQNRTDRKPPGVPQHPTWEGTEGSRDGSGGRGGKGTACAMPAPSLAHQPDTGHRRSLTIPLAWAVPCPYCPMIQSEGGESCSTDQPESSQYPLSYWLAECHGAKSKHAMKRDSYSFDTSDPPKGSGNASPEWQSSPHPRLPHTPALSVPCIMKKTHGAQRNGLKCPQNGQRYLCFFWLRPLQATCVLVRPAERVLWGQGLRTGQNASKRAADVAGWVAAGCRSLIEATPPPPPVLRGGKG